MLTTYNFRLFWRMAYHSFFKSRRTYGQLSRKRLTFLLLFYLIWPIGSFFVWLGLLLDDVLFPAYKQQPVERPLFILGNFRSGSTFLHRLVSRDTENFTSLTTWDIYLAPSVTAKKIGQAVSRVDRLVGSPLLRIARALDRRSLGKIRIHRISFFEPEEDENILMHIWSTYFISWLFPFLEAMPTYQFFDQALPAGERRRIMAFYKSMLQRHMYATGKKNFVAKNPAFSAKIETLAEFFPDARIIYLARNPLDAVPSTISWINYARRVFTDPGEGYLYREEIVKMSQYWYHHPLDFLDAHPSDDHLILKYDDLIGDPEGVVRRFYHQFGYAEGPGLRHFVIESTEEALAHSRDHAYSYEEIGFTRQEIIQLYADIFERFNFNKREPAPSKVEQDQKIPATD